MGRAIAIHSFRGGTGKTVIATNLAAIYANQGLNVALLDLDFRAPSLTDVFTKDVKKPINCWLNDFLDGRCSPDQALKDVSKNYQLKGKLLLGLANPAIEAIRNSMEKSRAWEVTAVKRLFSLKSSLFDNKQIDYCIFDTSPGIQYSSINALVSSEISILVSTPENLELEGVRNTLTNLYDSFNKETLILINKVFPETQKLDNTKQKDLVFRVENKLKRPVAGIIPCYCDVLQAKKPTILAIEKPNHPFVKNLEDVAKTIRITLKKNRRSIFEK